MLTRQRSQLVQKCHIKRKARGKMASPASLEAAALGWAVVPARRPSARSTGGPAGRRRARRRDGRSGRAEAARGRACSLARGRRCGRGRISAGRAAAARLRPAQHRARPFIGDGRRSAPARRRTRRGWGALDRGGRASANARTSITTSPSISILRRDMFRGHRSPPHVPQSAAIVHDQTLATNEEDSREYVVQRRRFG